jgi:DNA-binding CsgD family transcriptional regulator
LSCALETLATTPTIQAVDANGINLLSKRQLDVVRCVAAGLTNTETGQQLGLSKHTVKNYLLRIFEKLGVSNRIELLFLTLSQPTGRKRQNDMANGMEPATSGEPAGPFELPSHRQEETGDPRDAVYRYVKCLLSEKANRDIRGQLSAMKKQLARSLTPEQILDAERKATAWAGEPSPKPSLRAVQGARHNPIEVAKASSA